MLSDDCVEGGNIQYGCNDDCQQQATVEPRKSTSFSGLSILKNRNGGSSKGITKDYSRRNSRRDESKSNMNTRTVPPTLQDSILLFKFPETCPWYYWIWWKAFTTIAYFTIIYVSFVATYEQHPGKQSLANLLNGCTMSVAVILANNSVNLVWILAVDAFAFFTASMVGVRFTMKHTIFLFYCHQLEVIIGAMGYRRWSSGKLEENILYPTSLHGMIGFWLFPVCLAPTTVALFGAGAYYIFLGLPFADTLKMWWMSDLLGNYISFWLCMVLLTVTKSEVQNLFSKEKKLTTLILTAEVAFEASFIYVINHPNSTILTILCLPMLSFIAWRHHIAVSTLLQMYSIVLVTSLFASNYTNPTRVEVTAFYITVWVTLCVSSLIAVLVTRFRQLYANKAAKQEEVLKTLLDVQNLLTETQVFQRMRHEIKTPLHVVQGFSKELEAYPGLQDEPRTFAHHISESSSHILDVLSDLRDFFEVNSAIKSERNSCIDLHHVWLTTCQKIVSLGDKCGVEVIHSLHDGVPRFIKGDQRRLVQILLNLSSNAIKYTAPVVSEQSQKGLVTLLLQYSAEMKTIRMCVFDTGVGIPAHLQDSVCHTYVRDNEMAERLKVPGTGLGLSIASNLVRKMGGKLTFHSVVGLGTDFYVTIPIDECKDDNCTAAKSRQTVTPVAQNMLRILIVDDSEVSRHLLQCMLSRLGQTDVVEAKNCSEAISCVESMRANQNFDIVFLDLGLDPASTDHTMFLEEIKSGRLPCLCGTPIVITSSPHVSEKTWLQLAAMGAKAILDKPYNLQNVVNVAQLLANSKADIVRPKLARGLLTLPASVV